MAFIGQYSMVSENGIHVTVDSLGIWRSAALPDRLLTYNEAITLMVLVERLDRGYPDDDPFVAGWRSELGLSKEDGPQ